MSILPASLAPWLETCPLAILVLDHKNVIRFANGSLAELCGLAQNNFVDHTADALPHPYDRLINSPGNRIELKTPGHATRWIKRWAAQWVNETDDLAKILYFQDVSPQIQNVQRLAELENRVQQGFSIDPITGLADHHALKQMLSHQIARSRRYGNPLGLIGLHLTTEAVKALESENNQLALNITQILRERLRWVDQIGIWEPNSWILVLPETGTEDVESVRLELDKALCEGLSCGAQDIGLSSLYELGVTTWQQGDDLPALLGRLFVQGNKSTCLNA